MVKENTENRNDLLIFTIENLPEGIRLCETFDMVQYTGRVQLSKKGLFKSFIERNKNEYQEVLNTFKRTAPKEANAIIGVSTTTTIAQFDNGSFIFITYTGTPAKLQRVETKKE